MLGRLVLGLDIGSYAVKAAELKAGLRGVEFVRLEQMILPRYASPEEREATIQLFLEQRGLSREFLVTALAADRLTQRHLRFPFSGSRRVGQAITFEIEQDLPIPVAQVIITHEQVPASPEQTDALAVLAPRTEVEMHLASMRRMEMEPRIVESGGACLANLSNYLDLADVGRLLVDVGHRNTNLCMLVDGTPVLVRSIAMGGHQLTEAIARDMHISYEEAEVRKHEEGIFESASTKPRNAGVRAVLEHLVREVARSVQSVVGDPLDPIAPAEIVLMGGSAGLVGLTGYFAERTGLVCEVLTVPPDTPGASALAASGVPVFAQAAALALRGSTTERVTQMDFRQDAFEYSPDLSGLRGQLQVTIALFGLLLVLWIASLGTQLWSARSRAGELQRQIANIYGMTFPEAAMPADPVAAMDRKLREFRELSDHLGVTGEGLSALEVLRHISTRIPESLDISLSELRLERHSVHARGYSRDFVSVDRVKEELAQVEFFEDVVLSDVVNEPRRGGKSFSLTIKFRGGNE